jgi:fatty acid desaturase
MRVSMTIQWNRSPGKKGSHFHPDSDLFVPNERKDVITSTACWTAMAALLVCLSFVMGPFQVLKLYGIPYWVGLALGFHVSRCHLLELLQVNSSLVLMFILLDLPINADFCYVVGPGHLFASPWS